MIENWVYDLIIGLRKYTEAHPPLYTFAGKGPEKFERVDKCPCFLLDLIPRDILNQADAIASYNEEHECGRPDDQQPAPKRDTSKQAAEELPTHSE